TPVAASTASAWMTLPRPWAVLVPAAPTAVSSSQRRPHLVKLSTADGEMVTTPSGQLSGRSSEMGVSAYHSLGCAPGTPAAASLASCLAAALRILSGRVGS